MQVSPKQHFSFDLLSENLEHNIQKMMQQESQDSSNYENYSTIEFEEVNFNHYWKKFDKFTQVYTSYMYEIQGIESFQNVTQQELSIRNLTQKTIQKYIFECNFQQAEYEKSKTILLYARLDFMFIKMWYLDPLINQYNLLIQPLQEWFQLIDKFNQSIQEEENQTITWDYQFFQILIRGNEVEAADFTYKNCQNRDLQSIIKNHKFSYQDCKNLGNIKQDRQSFIDKIQTISQQIDCSLPIEFFKALQGNTQCLLKYCNYDWKQFILLYLMLNIEFNVEPPQIRSILLANQRHFQYKDKKDHYFFTLTTAQNYLDVLKSFDETDKVWVSFFCFKLLMGTRNVINVNINQHQLQTQEQYYRFQLLLSLQDRGHKFETFFHYALEYLLLDQQETNINDRSFQGQSPEIFDIMQRKAFESPSLIQIYHRTEECFKLEITYRLGLKILKSLVQQLFQDTQQLQPAELGTKIFNFLMEKFCLLVDDQPLNILEEIYKDQEFFQILFEIYKQFLDSIIIELQKPLKENFVSQSLLSGYQTRKITPLSRKTLFEPLLIIIQIKTIEQSVDKFYQCLLEFFNFQWEKAELQYQQARTIISILFLEAMIDQKALKQIFSLRDQDQQVVLINLSLICVRIQKQATLDNNKNEVLKDYLRKSNFVIQKLLQ